MTEEKIKTKDQDILDEFDEIEREEGDDAFLFRNKLSHEMKSIHMLLWFLIIIGIIQFILVILLYIRA